MRGAIAVSAFASICIAFGLGCSSTIVVTDSSDLGKTVVERVDDHRKTLRRETSAQLMQVTIRSSKLTRRFGLEVFHRDGITAFYTAGFAGKGSFKGLLSGLALKFALLNQKQYYAGPVSELVEPDLGSYEYVVVRLRELLSGNLLCDSSDSVAGDLCAAWKQELHVRKDEIKKVVFRSIGDPIVVEANFFRFSNDFPYFRIRNVTIRDFETGSTVKLKLIEQRYGPVPDIKFSLPDFANWERVDHFEIR